jgi:hypothetical protein
VTRIVMVLFIRNLESSLCPIPIWRDCSNKKGDNAIWATRKQPSSRVSGSSIGWLCQIVKESKLPCECCRIGKSNITYGNSWSWHAAANYKKMRLSLH